MVRQGHEVVGVRRSEAGAEAIRAAGMEAVIGDIASSEFALPAGRFDALVFTASSGAGAAPEAIRRLRLEGLAKLVGALSAEPPKKFVYASSVAVYGQVDGSAVKETSLTEPQGSRAKVWLEAERWLLRSGKALSPVVLRLGEIYGPGRELFVEAFAKNRFKIPGQGQRHLNLIHRDDLVSAILAALKSGRPGEVYNVVDDEPIRETPFYSWLSETLGKWMPPSGPEESDPERMRELANCKVSNRRLTMELGCRLKYPNFRLGYTAEIKRMTDEGSLEIVPEER